MNPIELTDRAGTVWGYACSTCRHIAGGSTLMWKPERQGPRPELVEYSLMGATSCCRCHTCNAPLEYRGLSCDDCHHWWKFKRIWAEVSAAIVAGVTTIGQYDAWLSEGDE